MLPIVTNKQKTKEAVDLETRPLWTVNEVARYLRLNPETVRQMAREATIPAIKMKRAWRFRSQDIRLWLESHVSVDNFISNEVGNLKK